MTAILEERFLDNYVTFKNADLFMANRATYGDPRTVNLVRAYFKYINEMNSIVLTTKYNFENFRSISKLNYNVQKRQRIN